MVVMSSVAPPGGHAEGGEHMVTLADHKQNEKKKTTKVFTEFEEEEDDFRPLVIDTRNSSTGVATSMEQDKQRLLQKISPDLVMSPDLALYRENNPPSDAEGDLAGVESGMPHLLLPAPSVFPGVHSGHSGHSDSSTPSSRVPSPTPSTASNAGGSSGRSKLSHPQKARRKTDKILPVDGGKYICPICHAGVSSNTELTKHIRSHNNGGPLSANTCTICGKVLSSQSSLDRHMLVHSGERPFKCKYCTMSFTTNGNMHRHSRIHEKEVRTDRTRSLPVKGSMSSPHRYTPTASREMYSPSFSSPSPASGPRRLVNGAPFSHHHASSGSKRKLSFDPQEGPLSLNTSAYTKRRAFGLVGEMSSEYRLVSPECQTVKPTMPSPTQPSIQELNSSRVKTNINSHNQESESDDHQELQCSECPQSFLCQYGLESHLESHMEPHLESDMESPPESHMESNMESHPESHLQSHPESHLESHLSFTCQLCAQPFPSRQQLLMHKFENHKGSVLCNTERTLPDSTGLEDVSVGFHELDFIDFTCEKFPLIAQAWCDENMHTPSSAFHHFSCNICKKAFPCKASLKIHSNAHILDDMAACEECEIHLEDHRAHKNHMLNHIAPKVVSLVSSIRGASDTPQKVVSKEDFLTCFGLTISKESTSEKLVTRARQEDMRVNEDYYPLLEHMAHMQAERKHENNAQIELMNMQRNYNIEPAQPRPAHHRHSAVNHDLDSSGDLADIQQILSHFGSGGGLVQIRQSMSPSPLKHPLRTPPIKPFNPMVMVPVPQIDATMDIENRMRLPVMVNSGFMPIQNHSEDGLSSGSNEVFQCKYCPEVFNNFKSYKSHTRTHLGLAPYKCSLCPYSSADKSTLIRHLRTHNGERPFQCRICDFAFTTKANCERHVRKKHMRFSKKDIDDVIAYNQYPSELAQDIDLFGSPDTVCKFCGEDFKFFRALKHHLRSHSSCTRKPFTCRVCDTEFSTKANVMHHIQKQHPEVEERHLEDQIYINELLAAEVAEDTKVYESIEVMTRSPSPAPAGTSTPQSMYATADGGSNPIVISPIPHYAPPTAGTFISSPPIFSMNPVSLSVAEEQPLDFSMKASLHISAEQSAKSLVQIENSHMSGGHAIDLQGGNDEPMDLTLKPSTAGLISTNSINDNNQSNDEPTALPLANQEKPANVSVSWNCHPARGFGSIPLGSTACSPQFQQASKTTTTSTTPAVATPDYGMLRYKKDYQKYYNPTVGRLQCPYCKMLFKHGLKLQVHIRSHTNERPFSCAYCSASFTIKTNLERHLKTRHPLQPPIIPEVPSRSSDGTKDVQKPEVLEAMVDKVDIPKVTMMPRCPSPEVHDPLSHVDCSPRSLDGSDDSSCELSSVTKIIDATNPTHFRSFFTASVSDESASEQPHQQSVVTHTAVPTPAPFLSYQDHEENSYSNHSGSNSQDMEDDPDSDGDGEAADILMSQIELTPEQIIRQTTEKLEIIKIRNPKNAERSADEGSGSPTKKKRNSYADSPHKLMCPYCPRAFPWISSLNRHILTHTGQKPFKCSQCPVMFSTKSNRERHLVRKHGLNVLDPATRQMMDRPFKCHLCVFNAFSTGGNLHKHYEEKHPETPMPEQLEEGDLDTNTDTYITECQENLEVAEASKAKQLEFGLDDDDSKDVIQDGLGTKLMDHVVQSAMGSSIPRALTPLSRSVSPIPVPASPGSATPVDRQQVNPERDNYNVDKITECWKCEEVFGSRKGLLRHLKEHNIDLAFKCYLCDASYDHRLQCVEHMALRHPTDWALLCDKNQITDIAEFADCMNRIVEQHFIGNSSFGKKLTEAELARYKVQLLEDMKPESDYTQRKVYCSLCPKRFWSLQDLRRHMRSHTGERPFECDLCQKRFTLKHSMMRHRRKHTDSRAASVSASDDESGQTTDMSGQNQTRADLQQKRREMVVAKMAAAGGDAASLATQLNSDLLHNLLGVENSAIEEMLNSYSADAAARVLGVTSQ